MLDALGWDLAWAEAAQQANPSATPGRVARVDKRRATVLTEEGTRRADPGAYEIAVGDWVLLDGLAVVHVLQRRSAFVRGASIEGRVRGAQVVAANIDMVFVVHSLTNRPNVRRLERELVLAHDGGATPVVVLNKADAVDDTAIERAVADVAAAARETDVVVTSAKTGSGVERLRDMTHDGRTVALIGASGVGKSTLLNTILGEDVQATYDVRASDQRGRHTTTARELVTIPGGGVLIDTPGLRAVAMWDAEDGLSRAFADIERLAASCRFSDCAHGAEPDCAVQKAIARGELDAERLAHYNRLVAEVEESEKFRRAR